MSDLELRKSARSARTSTEVAALFAKQLRAGIIKKKTLWIWAYMGLEPAREVLGECPSCVALKGDCGYVARCLACGVAGVSDLDERRAEPSQAKPSQAKPSGLVTQRGWKLFGSLVSVAGSVRHAGAKDRCLAAL